jgi:hypothetical protein
MGTMSQTEGNACELHLHSTKHRGITDQWNVLSAERAECSYCRNPPKQLLEAPDQTFSNAEGRLSIQGIDCGEGPASLLAFPMRFQGLNCPAK